MTDFAGQRKQVLEHAGFLRVMDRGLVRVTGRDRLEWLHNLTTNTVKTLTPGDGNYAFAINVQGRTLFDLNLLVLDDAVWLDIDRRWFDDALGHLNKYIVVEDVALTPITDAWARFDVLGAKTADVIKGLGLGHNFGALADVQHVAGAVDGVTVRCVKDNLGAISRAMLYAEAAEAAKFGSALAAAVEAVGGVEMDADLLNVLRIEAGVPRSVDDIDHAVIPPETLQIERGISYVKGCYLGQEVIERMRSRGSMARKLTVMRCDGNQLIPHNAPIESGEKEIGRVTSSCHSPAVGGVLMLGYVKTLLAGAGQKVRARIDENATIEVEILDGPLIR